MPRLDTVLFRDCQKKISKPNEYTNNFKSNLTCIFLSVRAKFKNTLCPQTLCISSGLKALEQKKIFNYRQFLRNQRPCWIDGQGYSPSNSRQTSRRNQKNIPNWRSQVVPWRTAEAQGWKCMGIRDEKVIILIDFF